MVWLAVLLEPIASYESLYFFTECGFSFPWEGQVDISANVAEGVVMNVILRYRIQKGPHLQTDSGWI